MNLEKLFGSKTKSDILKYLVFRRQGVSIRALESELGRTFPGIKKQIDSLAEAEILVVEKTPEKRAIKIADDVYEEIRRLIVCAIKHDTIALLNNTQLISKYYLGKIFYKNIDIDLVILYKSDTQEELLQELKDEITQLFKSYMIDPAYFVFMPAEEFEKRTKMADKFALQVVRSEQ